MTESAKLEKQREMGLRLRQIRDAKGLTQSQLAEIMGFGATTIAGWENGRNMLDVVALGKAAELLNFTTDFVILGRIGSLPLDLALQIQALQRSQERSEPRRGRPRRPRPPSRDAV